MPKCSKTQKAGWHWKEKKDSVSSSEGEGDTGPVFCRSACSAACTCVLLQVLGMTKVGCTAHVLSVLPSLQKTASAETLFAGKCGTWRKASYVKSQGRQICCMP